MLKQIIENIKPVDYTAMKKTKERIDFLAKPLGSLGSLEDIAIKLSGITSKTYNSIDKKCVIIMCSDNGVVVEGVSSAPQHVTLAQTKNFIKGKSGVASLSKVNNTDLIVVDVGINSDEEISGVINKKIRKSTNNIFKEHSMSYDEAIKSIEIGIETVKSAKDNGYDIIGVGEMGIGNTTTSSAVLCALTNCNIDSVVGKGAGITDESFEKKKYIVKYVLEKYNVNKNDVIDIVSKVGGFDLGAMIGVYLGCAYYKIPVVIDGFISVVTALCANKMNPLVKDYCFTSHKSEEIGYNLAINELGLEPILDLKMRLGEGSGCPIAFSVIDFANSMIKNMATFKESNIDNSYLEQIKSKENYIVKEL